MALSDWTSAIRSNCLILSPGLTNLMKEKGRWLLEGFSFPGFQGKSRGQHRFVPLNHLAFCVVTRPNRINSRDHSCFRGFSTCFGGFGTSETAKSRSSRPTRDTDPECLLQCLQARMARWPSSAELSQMLAKANGKGMTPKRVVRRGTLSSVFGRTQPHHKAPPS